MIIQSHPTVNAFVRALAEALDQKGRLAAFHTTIASGRRSLKLGSGKLQLHPWREVLRLAASRLGVRSVIRHENGVACVDAVYQSLDRAVSRNLKGATAVYAYEDGALATFLAAQMQGLHRIYELPIAYWQTVQRLLNEEAERLPEWVESLGAPQDSEAKLERKTRELAAAGLVVCPSKFVQDTLPIGTHSIVAAFGSPAPLGENVSHTSSKLRVLFVGSMTQRKGLADIFIAMKKLGRNDVELVVLGSPVAPMEFYRTAYPDFIYEKPRPHSEVLALMETCDVLLLPSIVEGRALVQQEALSRGLPLIVTANAGGEDLIEPGVTGWLIPIRNPDSIVEKIHWFADHRKLLPDLRLAAQRKAAQYTWADYTHKIMTAIDLLA